MATKNPRITITLTQRQHDVLHSISTSSGQSMSSIVMECVNGAMPVFEKMAVTFQHLKNAKLTEQRKFTQALEDAHAAFEPLAIQAADQFDFFVGKVEALAIGPGARAARPAPRPGAAPDPLTNRGVTVGNRKGSKPTGRKASQAISGRQVSKKKGEVRQHKNGGAKS
jgi:hypothetical protein